MPDFRNSIRRIPGFASFPGKSNVMIKMSMQHRQNEDRGKQEYLVKILSHCHVVHHKSQSYNLGPNPGLCGDRRVTDRVSHGTALLNTILINST
jgi:hypothetical protein